MQSGRGILGGALIAVVIAIGVVIFFVLQGDDEEPSSPQNVTLEELNENRGKYLGRTVTVDGSIKSIVGPSSFTLEPDPGNVVLVVAKEPLEASRPKPVSDGERVRVTGRVTSSDAAEDDIALEFPGEEPGRRFGDAPVILDATVTVTPGSDPEDSEALTGAELSARPGEYVGELTTVNAEVGQVLEPGAFTVDGLLAVSKLEAADQLSAGEQVQLTGQVRRFEPDKLQSDYGVTLPGSSPQRDDEYLFVVSNIDFARDGRR